MNPKSASPRILGLILLLCGLAAQDASTVKQWAKGLDSSNATERHATIDAIESQGFQSFRNLREIVRSVPGEPRARALDLIERIGTQRLLRPTRVTLDVKNLAVIDVIQSLGESSGFLIEFDPAFKGVDRKVSLYVDRPISFFEALDRLGSVGEFRQDFQTSLGRSVKGGVTIRLTASPSGPPPTSYAGPYKVILRALERHRQVIQARNQAESNVKEEFFAILDVVAEPGILIERNGSATIREARDDRGQNLRAPTSHDPATSMTNSRSWMPEETKQFSYRLPLHLPENHGSKIARLQGFLPITAVARTDELFSSPIAGIQVKAIGGGGVTLNVTSAVIGSASHLDLTIRDDLFPDPRTQAFAVGPRQTTLATLQHGFSPDDHLRIENAEGRSFGFHSNGLAPTGSDGSMRFRITVFANPGLGAPARIRYFGVAGVATEVPFDFHELEIP